MGSLNLTAVLIMLERLSPAEHQVVLAMLERSGLTVDDIRRMINSSSAQPGGPRLGGNESAGDMGLEEQLMQYGEYKVRQWLLVYVSIIIFVIGSVGNVLSFAVLTRRSMRRIR